MKKYLIPFFASILLFSCSKNEELVISYSNPNIKYSGRIDSTRVEGVDMYWPGTSLKIKFKGESISVLIEDETGDNYYNVILDNDSVIIFRPGKNKKYHTLVSGLSKKEHTLELFRRTEWDHGRTTFYGFKINEKAELLEKPKTNKRKIEFYGNSITSGYAIEDFEGDSPDSTYTNNYLSYAALITRHFNAEYSCISKGGIGITVSWFPQIMPEVYDRINPYDHESNWNFSNYTPDIVVINLFQNDSWLVNMPEHEEFKRRFGTEAPGEEFIIEEYRKFVSGIRGHYSDADIICTLGSMDITKEGSKWPGYVEKAVEEINDPRIYTFFMPYKNTPGHPKVDEQEIMAKGLIKFIEENIEW